MKVSSSGVSGIRITDQSSGIRIDSSIRFAPSQPANRDGDSSHTTPAGRPAIRLQVQRQPPAGIERAVGDRGTRPDRDRRRSGMTDLWHKNAIFYGVDIKTFCDANGDGFGDIAGLIGKLDYIADLGVDCLWL